MAKCSKKVAVLTYHNAKNYGAVLQTYALYETLKSLSKNIECIVLNYECTKIKNAYKLFYINNQENIPPQIIRKILRFPSNYRKKKSFERFVRKYLQLTNKKYTQETIKETNGLFDIFIAGSDQIWNYKISGNDSTYFLDFVNNRDGKYSYAASFGFINEYNNFKTQYLEQLKNFNRISLRENIGVKDVAAIVGTPSVHIDPTLLLSSRGWEKILVPPKSYKKYILIYTILPPKSLLKYARELSQKTGLGIKYISASMRHFKDIEKISSPSPEEFLGLFGKAEYIFTTSFHGTVFSIIFKKKFFVELNGADGRYNDRIDNLLTLLGLEDCEIKPDVEKDYDREIDWQGVDVILDAERQKSFVYLKSIIENE